MAERVAMIYGYLESACWLHMSESLEYAIKFLSDRAADMPDGRHDLPHGMYAEIKEYNPIPADQRLFESHVKYIDIQCILEGEEEILVRPLDGLTIKEDLLASNDIAFYTNPVNSHGQYSFIMRPGSFLFLLPSDAHKTECETSISTGRKVIFKIPVSQMKP